MARWKHGSTMHLLQHQIRFISTIKFPAIACCCERWVYSNAQRDMLPPLPKNIPWLPKKKMDLRDEQWDVNGIGELQVQFWHLQWEYGKVVILLADPQMQSRNTWQNCEERCALAFNEGSISKTILGRCACATLFGLLPPNVRISIGGTRSWCEWGMCALLPIADLALLTGLAVPKGQFRWLLE